MSLFKDKNLKFYTYCNKIDKNKEIYDNSINNKHVEKMKNFTKNNKNLPKFKEQLNEIENKIEILSNQKEIDLILNKLNKQKNKILSDIEKIKNNDIIIPEKKKNIHVIIENNDTITNVKDEKINKLNKLIDDIDENINKYINVYNKNCYMNELKTAKKELEEKIYIIENEVDELEYFDDNYDILFNYFKKDEDNNTDEEIDLQKIFKKKNQSSKLSEKNKYADKYLQSINETGTRKKKVLPICECTKCGIPKTLNLQEGQYKCLNCGESQMVLVDSDKPSYKDPVNEVKTNTYRRANHCSELLNQKQGKESTDIDDNIFQEIINQLHIIGVTDLQTVNSTIIKNVLKSIGKSNKAEHAIYIINKLNGIPAPTISRELEETVKQMFNSIEEAWYIFKNPKRKNFMNTNFVFHKIFELLDEDEEAVKYPYLAPDKLEEHDELWEKICNYLQWEYIASI